MLIKEYYEGTATAQQVYDFVMGKLREQGVPSINSSGKCLYLYKGLKCGIGHLIPDGKHRPEMEINSGKMDEDDHLFMGGPWPMFRSLVDGEVKGIENKESFLQTMQWGLHDEWASPVHPSPGLTLLEGLELAAQRFCSYDDVRGSFVQYTPPAP